MGFASKNVFSTKAIEAKLIADASPTVQKTAAKTNESAKNAVLSKQKTKTKHRKQKPTPTTTNVEKLLAKAFSLAPTATEEQLLEQKKEIEKEIIDNAEGFERASINYEREKKEKKELIVNLKKPDMQEELRLLGYDPQKLVDELEEFMKEHDVPVEQNPPGELQLFIKIMTLGTSDKQNYNYLVSQYASIRLQYVKAYLVWNGSKLKLALLEEQLSPLDAKAM